jgi:dihydropteroate synthase
VEEAAAAGIPRERVAVDPGIGFGKTADHNLRLLADLPRLASIGCPVVVGLSRKRFLGTITGREAGERLAGSLAALAFAVFRGAAVVRVHDVAESLDAVRVAAALAKEVGAWGG